MTASDLERGAEALRTCDALLITAGAGIGVDSGLPDFRGNKGFWNAYPVVAKLGLSFVEMANPEWFIRNPRMAWAFYGHRLNLYRRTVPHVGFNRMLECAKTKDGGYFVFTSNVDGQFQKAGFADDLIEECHGSIHFCQCSQDCAGEIWDACTIDVAVDEEKFEALTPLPRCPECGGTARPNILMFGDWVWNSGRTDRQAVRFRQWLNKISSEGRRLTIVEIGAGSAVPTVRHTSETIAAKSGATLVRINPREADVPNKRHVSIALNALEGMSAITKS